MNLDNKKWLQDYSFRSFQHFSFLVYLLIQSNFPFPSLPPKFHILPHETHSQISTSSSLSKLHLWVFLLPSCFRRNCPLLAVLSTQTQILVLSQPWGSRSATARPWFLLPKPPASLRFSASYVYYHSRPPIFLSLYGFTVHYSVRDHTFLHGQPRSYDSLLFTSPFTLNDSKRSQPWIGGHC